MANFSPLSLARLELINEYAELEHQLCAAFGQAAKINPEIAKVIFFQISNTRSRYAIMSKVLSIHHSNQCSRSWPKIEKWLTPCDTARNHVVHWVERTTPVILMNLESKTSRIGDPRIEIRNPSSPEPFGKSYTAKSVSEETTRIMIMKSIVNRFYLTLWEPDNWPWTEIFHQPIADRSATEFLQRLNDKGHPTMPQSSQG